jgi:hypothetical protein
MPKRLIRYLDSITIEGDLDHCTYILRALKLQLGSNELLSSFTFGG